MLQNSTEPNLYFVERKSVSAYVISDSLCKQPCIVMSGLPGMGKTELASQFVRWARDGQQRYKGIFWVNADSETSFQTGVREMAREMNLEDDEKAKFNVICSLVTKELNRQDHWLLILDNLDQIEVAKNFLPEKRGVRHVIVTTRYRQAFARLGGMQIHLEHMSSDEAIELFLSTYHRGEKPDSLPVTEEVRHLVDELGCLPLAIIQAAAYIQETQDEISNYTDIYRSSRRDIWEWGPTQDESYVSVAAIMSIAFRKIKYTEAAVRLFCLFTFLGPDGIPEVLWTADPRLRDEILRQTFATKASLNKALQSLICYSLVQRSRETRSVSIHRLVQDVMRDILESRLEDSNMILESIPMVERSPKYWVERAIEILAIAYHFDVEFKVAELLDPHMSFCVDHCDRHGIVTEELGILLHGAGLNAWKLGDTMRARKLDERCLQAKETVFGINHVETAAPIVCLGVCDYEMGNHEQAILQFTRALEITEKEHGKGHIRTAVAMGNFGLSYNALGRHDEAEAHYKRELEMEEREYGIDSVETAHTIKQLGNTYGHQGKLDLELSYKQRALRILELHCPNDESKTSWAVEEVGNAYRDLKDYDKAAKCYQRALRAKEAIYGTSSIKVAFTLVNLGLTYAKNHHYDEAIEQYKRALRITQVNNNHSALPLSRIHGNLGQLFASRFLDANVPNLCDLQTAREHYLQRVLTMSEKGQHLSKTC